MPAPVEPRQHPAPQTHSADWGPLLAALVTVLAWDASGLDLTLAQRSGNATGFAWRDHALLSDVLHSGARAVGWGVLLACTALAVWPLGPLKTLSAHERRGWIGSIWLALLAVVLLKGISQTSCPWDLEVFGGSAQHLSHWAWGRTDGGPGHCFPAGHASTGFAFVAGGFWLAPHHPTLARRWWWAAGAAGAVLGGAQQLRGAHFMSHTLWSGWLCWAMGVAIWHWSKRRFQ